MSDMQREFDVLNEMILSADGLVPSGVDAQVGNDPNDKRLVDIGMRLKSFAEALREVRKQAAHFRNISELITVLPENDPRRMDGLLAEIDIDVDVIAQAADRLSPRIEKALQVCGTKPDADAVKGWVEHTG